MPSPVTENTPLSDLCGICHANAIKYTCPRCGLHTCSLPCVKLHKLQAQCSGVRNPAAFKKRAELATPSSVDQDYNFITSVERSLQRADDETLSRGINLVPSGLSRRNNANTKSPLELALERNGTVVIRAPKGLSRSKQNRTQWIAQRECLVWTIEWRLPADKKIFANARGAISILEAYRDATGDRHGLKKRKRSGRGKNKYPEQENEENDKQEVAADLEVVQELNIKSVTSLPPVEQHHFYLHRPNTPSKYKCVIPIPKDGSLNEALKDRTVLEFPTIFVLAEGPESISAPFITEAEYIQKHDEDIRANLPMQQNNGTEEGEITSLLETVDDKKVLEVLQKDLAG